MAMRLFACTNLNSLTSFYVSNEMKLNLILSYLILGEKNMANPDIKSAFKTILAEFASIVVAVLFALWANNWWAEKQREQEVKELMLVIKVELQENLNRLQKSHQHHTSQLTVVANKRAEKQTLDENDYLELNRSLFKKGIYQTAELYFTYWEILNDKNLLVDITNEELSALKPVYTSLKRYQLASQNITGNSINIELQANSEKVKVMVIERSIAQLWWLEKSSIKTLQDALVKLSK